MQYCFPSEMIIIYNFLRFDFGNVFKWTAAFMALSAIKRRGSLMLAKKNSINDNIIKHMRL